VVVVVVVVTVAVAADIALAEQGRDLAFLVATSDLLTGHLVQAESAQWQVFVRQAAQAFYRH